MKYTTEEHYKLLKKAYADEMQDALKLVTAFNELFDADTNFKEPPVPEDADHKGNWRSISLITYLYHSGITEGIARERDKRRAEQENIIL